MSVQKHVDELMGVGNKFRGAAEDAESSSAESVVRRVLRHLKASPSKSSKK